MLLGCFFWAAILGARVIFGAIPTSFSTCKHLPGVIQIVDGYAHSFIQDNLKVSDSLPEKFLGSLKRSEEYWMASVNDTL